MKRPVIAAIALAAGAASAQPGSGAATHRYTGPDGLKAEVETLPGRRGPFPHALRFSDEPASVLNFTDEIALSDTVILSNPREGLLPGARQPVSIFQMMPREGVDYSATMTAMCGGMNGIPFLGIENAGGSILSKGLTTKSAVRLYVFEETFAPGRVILRLCKAIDLKPR